MSEPVNTPYPQVRTPEQHAAVRRRALPVALGGALLGAAAVALQMASPAGASRPPSLLAVQLSFCALLMGVGILFYAKGTSGTKRAGAVCGLAILLGLGGTMIYAGQIITWRKQTEGRELQNVSAIAREARKYAEEHDGAYPADLGALVEGKYIEAAQCLSPFGGKGTEYMHVTSPAPAPAEAARHSDYTYVGGDLRLPLNPEAAGKIIVVYQSEPVQRKLFAVGYADGTAKYESLEQAEQALKACNDARESAGLKPLARPESMEKAREAETRPG